MMVHFIANNDVITPFISNVSLELVLPGYNSTVGYRSTLKPSFVSGSPIKMNISLLDKDLRLYSINQGSKATLQFQNSNVIAKNNIAYSLDGTFVFD